MRVALTERYFELSKLLEDMRPTEVVPPNVSVDHCIPALPLMEEKLAKLKTLTSPSWKDDMGTATTHVWQVRKAIESFKGLKGWVFYMSLFDTVKSFWDLPVNH